MATPYNKTDAYIRDTIAKDIQYHIRAMNKVLKKGPEPQHTLGSSEVQTVAVEAGRYWMSGLWRRWLGDHSAIL